MPADDKLIRSYVRPPLCSLTQVPPLTKLASKSCFDFTSWVHDFVEAVIEPMLIIYYWCAPAQWKGLSSMLQKKFQLPPWHQKIMLNPLSSSFQKFYSPQSWAYIAALSSLSSAVLDISQKDQCMNPRDIIQRSTFALFLPARVY